MSQFLLPNHHPLKRCALCQGVTAHATYFHGRYVCPDCLSYIKNNL